MALELINPSTYQNNVTQHGNASNVATSVNVEAVNDSMVNHSVKRINPVEEHNNDDSETHVSEEHIKSEISKANSRLKNHNTKCEFAYHEGTNRVTIKVMDKDTSEVIREIPPEKTLEMIQKMWELAGLLIDERR